VGNRTLTRPKALKPGALIGIVSPASIVKPDLVEQGIAALHSLGYRTQLMPHAFDRGPLNYAGTLEARLADLHAAFADPSIDAILCTRGGWGTAELLPFLDAALIRANPKPFLGYSDLTTLHIWLRREANLISFQAPMVASDFAKRGGPDSWAPDLASWTAALTQPHPWTLGPASGLRVLQPGTAEGLLSGGCISILAESLGTPYAPIPEGGILFLEDVGTKPYQWDRLLLHLRYAGHMESVTGIVFGDMRQCCPPEEDTLMEATLLHALRHFSGPIAIGLRSGHVAGGNITLPFGVRVQLDLKPANPQMHFLEAAVSD
jgi:muramoyltetrapeptide carboxypeptidase